MPQTEVRSQNILTLQLPPLLFSTVISHRGNSSGVGNSDTSLLLVLWWWQAWAPAAPKPATTKEPASRRRREQSSIVTPSRIFRTSVRSPSNPLRSGVQGEDKPSPSPHLSSPCPPTPPSFGSLFSLPTSSARA